MIQIEYSMKIDDLILDRQHPNKCPVDVFSLNWRIFNVARTYIYTTSFCVTSSITDIVRNVREKETLWFNIYLADGVRG